MRVAVIGSIPRDFGLSKETLKKAAASFAERSRSRVGGVWHEVVVHLVRDAASDELHRAILGETGASDVITQAYEAIPPEPPGLLGELFVNVDQARRAAPRRRGWSPAKELLLYVAHGMDHLSGADDHAPDDYARMRRRELSWLAGVSSINCQLPTTMKKIITRSLVCASLMTGMSQVATANDVVAREDSFSKGHPVINIDGRAQVSLDRRDATYACGQEAAFTVAIKTEKGGPLATSGVVRWRLDNYGAHVFAKGTADLAKANPFTVKGTLPYPGFLRLVVQDEKGKQIRAYSAAYEPEKIRTGVPKPADFDRFWDEAMARLEREVPLDPQVEPIGEKGGIASFRVSFATFGGKRVYGVLTCPTDASKRPYPARVHCPGAGPGFILRNCGGNRDRLTLTMSVHNFPIPDDDAGRKAAYEAQEAKYRAIHGSNSARAYPVGGLTVSREAAHYFPVILGINRAVNWLAQRPDVDKKRITYSGASQGGGFGLYLAALNKNISRAYIGVPALADVMGCKADGRQSGWPRILEFETQKDPARLAKIEQNAPYLDGAYFAERITIPVRLSVGYADESCAPHAVLAAYNAIPSKDKKLYHGIGGLHGSPNAPMAEVTRWLDGEE